MMRSASLMGLLGASLLTGAFIPFGALFFLPAAKTFLGLLLAEFIFREIFSGGGGGGVGVEMGGESVVVGMIASAMSAMVVSPPLPS